MKFFTRFYVLKNQPLPMVMMQRLLDVLWLVMVPLALEISWVKHIQHLNEVYHSWTDFAGFTVVGLYTLQWILTVYMRKIKGIKYVKKWLAMGMVMYYANMDITFDWMLDTLLPVTVQRVLINVCYYLPLLVWLQTHVWLLCFLMLIAGIATYRLVVFLSERGDYNSTWGAPFFLRLWIHSCNWVDVVLCHRIHTTQFGRHR